VVGRKRVRKGGIDAGKERESEQVRKRARKEFRR